jgi:hypothetical protein
MKKTVTDLTNYDPVKVSKEFLDYLAQMDSKEAKDSKLSEELGVTLEEMGFTGEAKFRCKELFHTAVRNNTTQLQERLAALVGQYLPILESGDLVEALSDRVAELEAEIDFYEQESCRLASEQVSKLSEQHQLSESVVEALWNNSDSYEDLERRLAMTKTGDRPARRSTVEERMEELNESDLFSNGGQEYIDPSMRAYLKALGHK